MKVTFTGVPGEQHESVYMYGQNFPLNKAVDVTDPVAMRKLANHPHFKAEKTDADRKIDEQVKQQFAAAATAGLMEAQADAIRRDAGNTAAEPAPAPTEAPTPAPLRSALDYQQREGSVAPPLLSTEQLREQLAQREEQEQQVKEATDGNADAQRAGGKGAAQAARSGPGRTGKP